MVGFEQDVKKCKIISEIDRSRLDFEIVVATEDSVHLGLAGQEVKNIIDSFTISTVKFTSCKFYQLEDVTRKVVRTIPGLSIYFSICPTIIETVKRHIEGVLDNYKDYHYYLGIRRRD